MTDVKQQLDAVTRAWRQEAHDGVTDNVQTLAQVYPATVPDLWDAVTSPERIPRWFLPVSGDLRTGGRYQLEGNAGGEILECSPPADGRAHYRITWEFGGGISWVTVRLTQVEDGTRFELEHVAHSADIPAEMADMFGPGATGVGWDGGLLGLSLHLSGTGGAIAPEDLAAWTASAAGQAFYRGAADAWGRAAVAAGVDEATAQRQADATFGFYTGAQPS
ncbi:SRPBCC domain-containing protein [Granulicoccus phenolivorans]|uniref:SRPBCC domain-containing protein n=1 Tax=Granulicoccus phenolivorans TaxID=266854 RepID=UPI00041A8D30|nr:SRPBCC domain-containing protein [Granulicoccus phenolivorans]